MKLFFESLDAFLAEVRDRKVDIVRISPALAIDTGRRTAGIPHLVSRVVTAALSDHHWAEWRHWVGRAIAEVGDRRLHVPAWLWEKQDRALAEVSNRVDAAGLLIREGILTHVHRREDRPPARPRRRGRDLPPEDRRARGDGGGLPRRRLRRRTPGAPGSPGQDVSGSPATRGLEATRPGAQHAGSAASTSARRPASAKSVPAAGWQFGLGRIGAVHSQRGGRS
jgi:hypothetical protein